MVVVDGQGIPLGSHTDSASPAEIRLLEKVMADIKVPKKGPGRPETRPKRVIGDKAYEAIPIGNGSESEVSTFFRLIGRIIET